MNFTLGWEVPFMMWLQTFASDVTVKICGLLSTFGESYIMIAAVGIFYWGINKEMGKIIAASFAVANIFAPCVKNVINRTRPYMDHESIKCLRQAYPGDMYDINVQGYSCPSLHASNTGTVFATIALCLKKRSARIILFALIILIGISRVILGVHYPTDVLLGWVIAVITVTTTPIIVKKLGSYLRVLIVFAIVGLPGWFFCTSDDFFVGYGAIIGIFLAFHIEEKYVHFENTKNIIRLILRTILGIIVTLAVLEGLKIFFPAALMDTPGIASYLIRTFRYGAATFVGLGIYPMLFKHMDRFFVKKR